MKRVTVVCEVFAKDRVLQLLREVGAHGYTLFPVEGAGSKGKRQADIPEFSNLQIEVIMQPAAAEALLARLEKELFPRFTIIAYESDVRVLRPAKF